MKRIANKFHWEFDFHVHAARCYVILNFYLLDTAGCDVTFESYSLTNVNISIAYSSDERDAISALPVDSPSPFVNHISRL